MKLPKDLALEFVHQQPNSPRSMIEWCEAQIKDNPSGWRQRRGYGNNCQRHAVYSINQKKLCRLHAGNELLDLLFKNHPTHFYRSANQPALQKKP